MSEDTPLYSLNKHPNLLQAGSRQTTIDPVIIDLQPLQLRQKNNGFPVTCPQTDG